VAVLIFNSAVLLTAIVVALVLYARHRWLSGPPLAARTVEIHTKRPDDQTIRGVVFAEYTDRIVLIHALYRHSTGDQPIQDLQVSVPRENIAWFTEPEG
jgi:hypothetical protein